MKKWLGDSSKVPEELQLHPEVFDSTICKLFI